MPCELEVYAVVFCDLWSDRFVEQEELWQICFSRKLLEFASKELMIGFIIKSRHICESQDLSPLELNLLIRERDQIGRCEQIRYITIPHIGLVISIGKDYGLVDCIEDIKVAIFKPMPIDKISIDHYKIS